MLFQLHIHVYVSLLHFQGLMFSLITGFIAKNKVSSCHNNIQGSFISRESTELDFNCKIFMSAKARKSFNTVLKISVFFGL